MSRRESKFEVSISKPSGRLARDPITRKARANFFKDIFGKKGPDPNVVNDWLPPFVDSHGEKIHLEIAELGKATQHVGDKKFRMGKFDELGFFHSQLDDIPDTETKKITPKQQKNMDQDKEFARKVLHSILAQMSSRSQ
ncbi:hypothetical protein AAMO2058_001101300 [Amorphochlora amoebiformis]|mmetsp:Transcript_4268/g.6488  ORF Transcript_4268/g.6488 Transcript_4268/m.6488 type:complete len:139 (-) Transcript_4268:255-671(-)